MHIFIPVSIRNVSTHTGYLTRLQAPHTDIPVEVATEIFLWTHSCEDDDPSDVISFCCVSSRWKEIVYAIPIMWHHVVRLPRQASTSQALARIRHTINHPLYLSFRMSSHDSQMNSYLPLLEQFAHRWQHIEIVGKQLELVKMALAFTSQCELPILQSLTVRKEPFTLNSPGFGPLLLTQAPRLTQLAVSSFMFIHLTPSRTLVDVMLAPCCVVVQVLKTLSISPIQTLKLCGCTWGSLAPAPTIDFPSMINLQIDGIPWFILYELLGMLRTPRLRAFDVNLELDSLTDTIDLEESLNLTHHMPSITHLIVTAQGIPHPMDYVPALVFMLGWKFLSVTHFTTNLPVGYLSALHTRTWEMQMPDHFLDHGFFSTRTHDVPNTLPNLAFPRLVDLRCSDNSLYLSVYDMMCIVDVRSALGCPLEAVTCHKDQLSHITTQKLESYVVLHDWTEEEVHF